MSNLMQREILQQPEIIANLISSQLANTHEIARDIKGKFSAVLIAARGSSDNAARYAQYLLGIQNRLQVSLATPSIFSIYSSPPLIKDTLVIGISQSGMSPDIVSVLTEANQQGCPTLAITNDINSPLANAADYTLPISAGQEKAIAATKTYTATLSALALLSCALDDRGKSQKLTELQAIPDFISNTITRSSALLDRVERYRYMEQCAIISRGYNYATCYEIALKIKELTQVVAEPYSSADFLHGPIATVKPAFPVLLILPKGRIFENLAELLRKLKELSAETIIITNDKEIDHLANLCFEVPPEIPEWLTPIVCVIPGQLFAMRLAIEKGLNPDKPIGLSKVTETY